MCHLNILCQKRDGTCSCSKPINNAEVARPIAIPLPLTQENNVYSSLFQILIKQNEMIKSIAENIKLALEKVSTISEAKSTVSSSREEVTTVSHLQQFLCGAEIKPPYNLELISELPNPAYKERSFSLMLQIVDNAGQKVVLPEDLNFRIMLFTTENPPRIIKMNTAGDKILKGSAEAQGKSSVYFRKIAIKEVTSHFRNGCFFFVVSTKDSKNIRPLIVENFVVKARKLNNDASQKKKMKLEKGSNKKNLDS